MQKKLFEDPEETPKKKKLGRSQIDYKDARSILTETSGFMEDYDYSLNPYSGCSFGCTYCYAAFFSKDREKMDNWGYWVEVKENAVDLLKKRRKKPLNGAKIYLSSVTDPYQPIEKELELTREILKELADHHNVRLVVQTRSSLITRDIDLLKRFDPVQVNMTITTDSEKVRKVFEPLCPGNKSRLKAIKKIHEEGINACITMTPLLPVDDPHAFAKQLLETGIENYIVQPFHSNKGNFVAGTREAAMNLIKEMDWTDERYQEVLKVIKSYIPSIGEGKEGFKPI